MRVMLWLGTQGGPLSSDEPAMLLFAGRLLFGVGVHQYDAEPDLQVTTIGALVADGILDEVTRCGLPDSRVAWLYEDSVQTSGGVVAVLVEVTL